ncbi:hypothetical protein T11_991 [Trichinella zimbabwensis]|nr:hypothetical protein T11_991 [Trichinella zimbabwensis]
MFKIQVEETEDIDGNGDDSEKSNPDINIMKIIKDEMAVFEAVGQRPKTLQMLYDALITVPSISCEAERSFSAAGYFTTKL